MKKRNTLLVLLTIFFQIPGFSSELIYIDSIDNNTIYVSNSSLFIRNNIIYYFDIYNNFYSINNGKRERLFENELNTLNPKGNFIFARMIDTSLMAFPYKLSENENGIIIKDDNKWINLDASNSQLSKTAIFYDIIFGDNRELVLINTQGKVHFFNNETLSDIDCEMDFECMPNPFDRNVGIYYNGCYWYENSKSNFVKLCNRSIEKIIPYQDFGFDNPYNTNFVSFQIHQDKMYFGSIIINSIFSIYNDVIEKFQPLSDDKNIELRFEPHRPLYLVSFIFGNDGYIYTIYKESNAGSDPGPAPAGRSLVMKMTNEYEIVEILPIPNDIEDNVPYITHLTKDESDITNKKVYIGASRGFYIYDPEPTSVLDNISTGPGAVFLMDIFPNPSGDFVNVKYGADIHNAGKIKIFLTDLLGNKVKEYNSVGNYNSSTGYGNSRLDVSSLPTGSYQLVITDGNKYSSKNIMVIK